MIKKDENFVTLYSVFMFHYNYLIPMKTRLFVLILFYIFISQVQAQLGIINTLGILPSNPYPSDSVKIVCSSTFSSGGCNLSNSSFIVSENNITVYARHVVGPLAYICQTTDTITFGLFNQGNYNVIYYLINDYNQAMLDTAFTYFTVQQSTDIEYNKQSVNVKVYPNPFDEKTRIYIENYFTATDLKIVIYDMMQRQIKDYKDFSGNEIEINKADLSKGVYFYKLFEKDRIINTGKLIIR
jgi:hypothetical protein